MKKVLIVAVILLALTMGAGACDRDGEREIYEGIIRDLVPEMGDIFDGGVQSPNPPPEQPTSMNGANLNLPLIVQENTFAYNRGGSMRITSGGVLQRQVTVLGLREWEDIDSDVRSFIVDFERNPPAILYIKNDNTLWGLGYNGNGLLGDRTGVNRDSPVHIHDNIAAVYIHYGTAFALQTDKTLLRWGGGELSPVHVADGVVNFIGVSTNWERRQVATFQKSTGHIYRLESDNSVSRIFHEAVYEISPSVFLVGGLNLFFPLWVDYINADRDLMRQPLQIQQGLWVSRDLSAENERIASSVERVFMTGENTFYITLDGVLWGLGANANGELGDGTRAARSEPVRIAEDVIYARDFLLLKSDGTVYTWDSGNPVPQLTFENVAAVRGDIMHFQDGSVDGFDNVKIPREIAFD